MRIHRHAIIDISSHSACEHFAIKTTPKYGSCEPKLPTFEAFAAYDVYLWSLASVNHHMLTKPNPNTVLQQMTDTKASFIFSTQMHTVWTFYHTRCTYIGAG